MDDSAFLNQVFELIKGFGGMSWMLKFSAVLTLLIASMKVSFLSGLWDKLGSFKALAAPMLALLAGTVSMVAAGGFSLQGLIAYLFAGAGAVALHELLDVIKAIPGLGGLWVTIIDFVSKLLGGAPKA